MNFEEHAAKPLLRAVGIETPQGKLVTSADDAANAVRWLIVEATYVTGQIIRVDGGRWMT